MNLFLIRPYLLAVPYFGYAVNLEGNLFKNEINKFGWRLGLGGGVEMRLFDVDQNKNPAKIFQNKTMYYFCAYSCVSSNRVNELADIIPSGNVPDFR